MNAQEFAKDFQNFAKVHTYIVNEASLQVPAYTVRGGDITVPYKYFVTQFW